MCNTQRDRQIKTKIKLKVILVQKRILVKRMRYWCCNKKSSGEAGVVLSGEGNSCTHSEIVSSNGVAK